MSLDKYSYREYPGEQTFWEISNVTFNNFNLVVGKNSSGKSRLVATINSLAKLITGKRNLPYEHCEWEIELNLNNKKYNYQIEFENNAVSKEILKVDGNTKLTRDKDGSGKILYEKLNDTLEFKLPSNAIASLNRRDEVQHSFLIDLYQWADNVILFLFGSEFGRRELLGVDEFQKLSRSENPISFDNPDHVVKIYNSAYTKFKDKFDKAIIKDMKCLGYNLTDVGSDNVQALTNFPVAALTMFTVEKDLKFKNPQTKMSQGMWRALALVIHLNICIMSKNKELILIDDIGEGLDYERSLSLINLLINKAKSNNFQLITTSNDRFVMNEVPLDYWSVLKRKAGKVKVFNIRNSKKVFENFKYVGLNNFDFFASDFFDK